MEISRSLERTAYPTMGMRARICAQECKRYRREIEVSWAELDFEPEHKVKGTCVHGSDQPSWRWVSLKGVMTTI